MTLPGKRIYVLWCLLLVPSHCSKPPNKGCEPACADAAHCCQSPTHATRLDGGGIGQIGPAEPQQCVTITLEEDGSIRIVLSDGGPVELCIEGL